MLAVYWPNICKWFVGAGKIMKCSVCNRGISFPFFSFFFLNCIMSLNLQQCTCATEFPKCTNFFFYSEIHCLMLIFFSFKFFIPFSLIFYTIFYSQKYITVFLESSCLMIMAWIYLGWCCFCSVTKSYLAFSNPMDFSSPGFSVHGFPRQEF